MTADELVASLDRIEGYGGEVAHAHADELLLAYVPPEVRDAYNRVVARCAARAFV